MKKYFKASFILWLLLAIPGMLLLIRYHQYQMESRNQSEISEVLSQYKIPLIEQEQLADTVIDVSDFIDVAGLKQENADTVGYIRIDGTQIDYPVMKSEEEEKYLQRDFWGKKSLYGSIFMDNACYAGGINTVLYGHAMRSGEMFGGLKNYIGTDFLEEHPYMKYIDEDSLSLYRVYAVFKTTADDEALMRVLIPYTSTEFQLLQAYIAEKTNLPPDFLTWGDELLTLTTCEYSSRNGRLYVIGKLEKRIER